MKSKTNSKSIRLNSADWVKHDAGQVLSQILGFSAIRKSGGFAFDPVFRGFKLEQLNILSEGHLLHMPPVPTTWIHPPVR